MLNIPSTGLTPKAITHRIAKLKANAAEYEQGNGGSNGVSASSEGKSSGKSDATPSKKRARKGNAAKPNGTDDDDDIDGGYVDGMEPGSKRLKTKHTGPSEDDTTPKMENDSE